MAINKHDDYEALARLLYPSIEASGNVYYGQTRKLTLDEVLKRNSLGFDSHIESFYNDDHGYYDSYFCWRLGSLHGSIRVDTFTDSVTVDNFNVDFIKRILYADSEEIIYDNNLIYKSSQADPDEDYALDTSTIPIFGTIFAKYRLDKRSTTITNELNSGSYDSYEVDVEPVLDGIYVTDDFNPVNSIDDDISERHFYISKENGIDYLYIQILTSRDTGKILTFTALEESEISLSMGQPSNGSRVVKYRVSQGGVFPDTWETYHYDWEEAATPTGSISLTSRQSIQFKSNIEDATLFNNIDDCLKFVVNSGTVFVSGSCMSMCHPDIDESTVNRLEDYALLGLFSNVENMYGTPVLPNVRKLGIRCYEKMFYMCTSLTVAPKIPLSDVDDIENDTAYCYYNMFAGCTGLFSPPKMIGEHSYDHSGWGCYAMMFLGCTNLRSSQVIHHNTLDYQACFMMFNGCSSLKLVRCAAKNIGESSDRTTYFWLSGVPRNGMFIKSSANYSSGSSGIPSSWTIITKDDEYFAIHKDPETGFRIDKHIPSEHYKNDYLVTSGTDSETNGRGYIDNYVGDTIGKMERSFDENKTHKMNTYNPDGSFNQEIWGYKTFNSPVQFRNGLYGEDWSIYTFNYSVDPRVNEKSTVISRDINTSASMQIYRQSSDMGSVTNSVILSSARPSLTHSSDEVTATIEVKSTGDQYGNVNDSSITLCARNSEITLSPNEVKLNVVDGLSNGTASSVTVNPDKTTIHSNRSSIVLGAEQNDTYIKFNASKSEFIGDVKAHLVESYKLDANIISGILPHPQSVKDIPIGSIIPICANSDQLDKMNSGGYIAKRIMFSHINSQSFVIGLYFTFDADTAIKTPNLNKSYKYRINSESGTGQDRDVVFNEEITVPENCSIEFWCNDSLSGSTSCVAGFRRSYTASPTNIMYFGFPDTHPNESPTIRVSGSVATILTSNVYTNNIVSNAGTACLSGLFSSCSAILDASELYFPSSIGTADSCFYGMFYGCNHLEYPPKIICPLTLSSKCYELMFSGCALRYAPILPATTWADRCYKQMFYNNTGMSYVICNYGSNANSVIAPTQNWLGNDYPSEAIDYPGTLYISSGENIDWPQWYTRSSKVYSETASGAISVGSKIGCGDLLLMMNSVYVISLCEASTYVDSDGKFSIECTIGDHYILPEYKFVLINTARVQNNKKLIAYVMRVE